MPYNFYEASLATTGTPQQNIQELNQIVIDNLIEVASDYEIVKEQELKGGLTYKDIGVRLTSLINPKTGKNFGDQFRKIIFQQFNHEKWWGRMYQFDNKYWLTTNASTRINASAHSVLRLCNNHLKWIDKNGTLNDWQCVFDRDISSTNIKEGSENAPQIWGDIVILVQRNQYTDLIKSNDRFLFDSYAFQVKQLNNHISDSYLELYMFETQIQPNDDRINNIANATGGASPSLTETLVQPNDTESRRIKEGSFADYTIYKYVKGVQNTDTFTITASGLSNINYTLTIHNANSFRISCLKQSSIPLSISCTNDISGEITKFDITLVGKW